MQDSTVSTCETFIVTARIARREEFASVLFNRVIHALSCAKMPAKKLPKMAFKEIIYAINKTVVTETRQRFVVSITSPCFAVLNFVFSKL